MGLRKNKIGVLALGVIFLLLSGCAFQFAIKNPLRINSARQVAQGMASWYGPGYYGNKTANGEIYTGKEITAAHRTLPFNTKVKVVRVDNGKSVIVRINDRGPFKKGYIIDLSPAAAKRIDMKKSIPVKIYVIK